MRAWNVTGISLALLLVSTAAVAGTQVQVTCDPFRLVLNDPHAIGKDRVVFVQPLDQFDTTVANGRFSAYQVRGTDYSDPALGLTMAPIRLASVERQVTLDPSTGQPQQGSKIVYLVKLHVVGDMPIDYAAPLGIPVRLANETDAYTSCTEWYGAGGI